MNDFEVEKKFELTELVDLSVLGEVVRSLADMLGIQVRIFDLEGHQVFDSGGEQMFCDLLKSTSVGDKICQEIKDKLLTQALSEGSAVQIQSACGNRYTVFPIRHQFENLGRVVLGPYKDGGMDQPKLEAIAVKYRIDAPRFLQVYHQMPEISPERLKKTARFLSRFFDAFVFINAKRLITSLMHLELIMQSRDKIFQQMEQESGSSPSDKKEIERLKNMF
jgi:hypothetical protein